MLTMKNRETYLMAKDHHRSQKSSSPFGSLAHDSDAPPGADDAPPEPLTALKLRREDARHVTEIHFADRGLKRLHPNFKYFINLESLWLNDNQIENVEGLLPRLEDVDPRDSKVGCVRLKYLYLSRNNIAILGEDISRLRFLEILLLSDNKLSNAEVVSARLRPLRYLKQLDLFNNPLAEEKNYREYFIVHHPSLEVLDRHTITPRERSEAPLKFPKRSSGRSMGHGDDDGGATLPHIKSRGVPKLSPSVRILEKRVEALNTREEEERQRKATEEERLFRERYERRKAFHARWPTRNSPAVSVTNLPASSRLQPQNNNSSATYVPPEHQRDMASMFYHEEGTWGLERLLPERQDAPLSLQRRVSVDGTLDDKFLAYSITQQELETLRNSLGTNVVAVKDVATVLHLLQLPLHDSRMSGTELDEHLETCLGPSRATVEVRAIMNALARYPPFLESRRVQLEALSRNAYQEGNYDGSLSYVRRCNGITEILDALAAAAALAGGGAACDTAAVLMLTSPNHRKEVGSYFSF